jgi:hypothetical protein
LPLVTVDPPWGSDGGSYAWRQGHGQAELAELAVAPG